MLPLLLLAARAHAGCPATVAQLNSDISAALSADAAMDDASLAKLSDRVSAELSCLDSWVDPGTAARVHLLVALKAQADGRIADRDPALRGLVAADPKFLLPAANAPDGAPIRVAFNRARVLGGGATDTLSVGAGVDVEVDGRTADGVPLERSSIVQVRSPAALQTWYVAHGPIPNAIRVAAGGPAVPASRAASTSSEVGAADRVTPRSARRPHSSTALLAVGAAVGAASGALLIHAQVLKSGLDGVDTEDQALALARANHSWGYAGYGLGAAAAGLGVSAVIVGKW